LHHPRQVLTRDQILDLVWGYNFDSGTNSFAVYIGYLRRKLEEANECGSSKRCAAWGTRFAPRDLSLAGYLRHGRRRGHRGHPCLLRVVLTTRNSLIHSVDESLSRGNEIPVTT
jgi:hypothetical protein